VLARYINPILPGCYPDPSVVRVGSDYYLVTSSFEYFPGIPIFHGKDLASWTQIGHVLTRTSQVDLRGRRSSEGIFAPTIRFRNGVYYVITTDVGGIGNFYVTATNPAGPWSDPIRLPYGNIDPSLFFDEDGKAYVTVQQGSGRDSHIVIFELDVATGKPLAAPQTIWQGEDVWTEGSHLYKIFGRYYILSACGGTGRNHHELAGRANSPYGPFERCPRPILSHVELPDHPIQCTGHADLVDDSEGRWWAVFLGTRPIDDGYSVLGRESFLAPVRWTDDRWPMIDSNRGVVVAASTPVTAFDDFEQSSLALVWNVPGYSADEIGMLGDYPGWLGLRSHIPASTSDTTRSFVGRRQQHRTVSVTTRMRYDPGSDGDEAGLAIRTNDCAHAEVGVRMRNGRREIFFRATRQCAVYRQQSVDVNVASSDLRLRIVADTMRYYFLYEDDSASWKSIGDVDTRSFAPEAAGGFVGVYLGMYVDGFSDHQGPAAYFDFFEYRSREDEVDPPVLPR